ncbi:hypothetical protein ACC694_37845, partial [Rhizobium ruizarguesonis]
AADLLPGQRGAKYVLAHQILLGGEHVSFVLDVGGIGMGLVRMVRPWNEWLIVWGYDINQPAPQVEEAFATKVVRELVGVDDIEPKIKSVS